MNMVCHTTYLNGGAANITNNTSYVREDSTEVFFSHLYTRALDVENQMHVDFN